MKLVLCEPRQSQETDISRRCVEIHEIADDVDWKSVTHALGVISEFQAGLISGALTATYNPTGDVLVYRKPDESLIVMTRLFYGELDDEASKKSEGERLLEGPSVVGQTPIAVLTRTDLIYRVKTLERNQDGSLRV
jgi:hypothetical protein